MRLTPAQRAAIADARTNPRGWLGCHPRTVQALVDKGLAHYESAGFSDDLGIGDVNAYLNEDVPSGD